jgi:hypothetical protein
LYFFCRNEDPRTSSPVEIASSLVIQIVNSSKTDVSTYNRILAESSESDGFFKFSDNGRTFSRIAKLFIELLKATPSRDEILIIVDGIDECSSPSKLVKGLLLPCIKARVRVLVTGRTSVRQICEGIKLQMVRMSVNSDIFKFVSSSVGNDPRLQKHRDAIVETISQNSDGMFSYAGKLSMCTGFIVLHI